MQRSILCFVLATGLAVSGAFADKEKDPDVQKALTKAYPDAKTQVIGTRDVNGVKVTEVKVTTKEGDSTAEVTEYGDFLMYGVPHENSTVVQSIERNTQGLFKNKPTDVDMYRVTSYVVDLRGPNNKTISARFDAVGRLKDIMNQSEIDRASQEKGYGEKASADEAAKITTYVQRYLGKDTAVQGVYKANQGDNFYYVVLNNGHMIVSDQALVYDFNQTIEKNALPKPIADTINQLFGDEKILKASRGEYEYYQFDQQSVSGEPIVVKMRPNGDILEVRNDKAREDDQAMTAKHKNKSAKAKKSG